MITMLVLARPPENVQGDLHRLSMTARKGVGTASAGIASFLGTPFIVGQIQTPSCWRDYTAQFGRAGRRHSGGRLTPATCTQEPLTAHCQPVPSIVGRS